MRKSNLSKYDTDKWSYTNIYTSLADGSYRYTGAIVDQLGYTATTGRTINIDATAPTITITNPTTTSATSKTITATGSDGTLTMTA